MKINYTLQIKNRTITFGILDTEAERIASYKQRCSVYSKYGYITKDMCHNDLDKDEYDDESIHIGAYDDTGRLLASIRLINTETLPIQKSYTFTSESNYHVLPHDSDIEFSRLVVERVRGEDDYIPRNVLMIFMGKILLTIFVKLIQMVNEI